jgi:hypothetical protein
VHLLVDVLTALCIHSCSTHPDTVVQEKKVIQHYVKPRAIANFQTVRDSKQYLCLTTRVSGMPIYVSDATAL